MRRNSSYKGFNFRRVEFWSALHDRGTPVFCRCIRYVEYLIIRNGRILDRAKLIKTAKQRIDSGLYD